MSGDAPEQPKVGRPSEYCEATVVNICQRIIDGETLRAICLDESMPARSSVNLWLALHPEFSDRYARACVARADAWADDVLAIADDSSDDVQETDSGPRLNTEFVQRSKLRVDARKWLMAKAAPKKYGDKLDLTADLNVRKSGPDLSGLNNIEKDTLLLLLEKAEQTGKKDS